VKLGDRKRAKDQFDSLDPGQHVWASESCAGILYGDHCIDTLICGDGYLESIEANAEFGCVLWKEAEDE